MKWEQRSLLICGGSRLSSCCAMVGEEEEVSGRLLKSHWFIIVLSWLVILSSSVLLNWLCVISSGIAVFRIPAFTDPRADVAEEYVSSSCCNPCTHD